jgi:hypothetical protein
MDIRFQLLPQNRKRLFGKNEMKKIIADDYKGKWFVLQDEDVECEYERKEINVEYVMNEGLKEHIENCRYYGIPSYHGDNKELKEKIAKIEEKLK